MVVERVFLLLAAVRPTEFEEVEDGKNVFASPVSTLESSPSSAEPASIPTKTHSTNASGPKPVEVMPDDNSEDFFASLWPPEDTEIRKKGFL